ncbi:helix-turn-helix transcriptional regulator [Pseudoscardovia suis]
MRRVEKVPDDLVDTREAAELTGFSARTLCKWRCERTDGPRYWKLGRRVRYSRRELSEWMDSHAVHAVSGGGQ